MAIPKPEDIFPDANALGRVLLDKIDPATPSGICLNKDDGEKILLYVATTIMDSVYALGTAIETEIQGNVNIDGTDFTSDQRKQRLRDRHWRESKKVNSRVEREIWNSDLEFRE